MNYVATGMGPGNIRRRHRMPFGAETLPGGVRFRLWAPAAQQVALCLEAGRVSRVLPMEAVGDGWFALETGLAGPGTCYRFRVDGAIQVPDPASRYQPGDVDGPSEVIDPLEFEWTDGAWTGHPWAQTVIYELHVGAFSPEGTYAGAMALLPRLTSLGVTAIELMPLADFPGRANWGYDGVLPFAPDSGYGRPEELKALIDVAHARGLMVFLDVVYNHFGPEGNYLWHYAPAFFDARRQTPWGAAINFDGEGSAVVRQFFIENALYWLEEFHVDGLRIDAVHTIADDSKPHFLEELASAVSAGPGAGRNVHLMLENDRNEAHYLASPEPGRRGRYAAQWNDDLHHALHVLLTGEGDGYYEDYADAPLWHLGRSLAEGFSYQGEVSRHRGGVPRGELSAGLPPTAFIGALQNHDQIGNRAFGERIMQLASEDAVRAATAVLLLAPSIPLLFMGEEWGASEPFPFFCDFSGELAAAVTRGRRAEFGRFPAFRDAARRALIPDPNARRTFESARLRWRVSSAARRRWLWHRELLAVRHREIMPRIADLSGGCGQFIVSAEKALTVSWRLADGSVLALVTNLGAVAVPAPDWPVGTVLYAAGGAQAGAPRLPPWSVIWLLDAGSHGDRS